MGGELGCCFTGRTECCIIESVEIFANRPWRILRFDRAILPVFGVAGVLLLDICDDQTGISGKALAADQSLFNTARNGHLKNMTQQVTLAKATVTVFV